MRQINYIIINPTDRPMSGLTSGFHYTVNSQGLVFNAIDIRKPGAFHRELNRCSIGIQFNGDLESESIQRAVLIEQILELRAHFPSALILGLSEVQGKEIRVSDAMNRLRLELSDLP